jgi:hypothetical protein
VTSKRWKSAAAVVPGDIIHWNSTLTFVVSLSRVVLDGSLVNCYGVFMHMIFDGGRIPSRVVMRNSFMLRESDLVVEPGYSEESDHVFANCQV